MKGKRSSFILLATTQLVLFGTLLTVPGENYYSSLETRPSTGVLASENINFPLSMIPKKVGSELGDIDSTAALAMDVDSAVLLYEKNIRQRVYPASTTKVMTALLSIENFPLDKIITIPQIETPQSRMNLRPNETISIESLIYGALIPSGNDAAEALAISHPQGRERFIEMMNEKAMDLHLLDTHFENPTGLDSSNHYSTALDLARLSIYSLRHPVFAKIVATEKISVYSSDGAIEHKLVNINKLLGTVEGVKGVKTGYTEGAGESLIALTEREGHRILTVILGSHDRFGETKKIVEWAFANHIWAPLE